MKKHWKKTDQYLRRRENGKENEVRIMLVVYLQSRVETFESPRSILRIKPRMYADGLLPGATTTTPIAT